MLLNQSPRPHGSTNIRDFKSNLGLGKKLVKVIMSRIVYYFTDLNFLCIANILNFFKNNQIWYSFFPPNITLISVFASQMAQLGLFNYSSLYSLPEQVTLWSRNPLQSERERVHIAEEEGKKSLMNHFAMVRI